MYEANGEHRPGAIDVRIDSGAPLAPELVATVDRVCDRAEDTGHGFVVLRVVGVAGAARPWPGAVGIHLVNKWERTLRRLERLAAATIAVAEGACGGPTLNVLLATDYRIGTPDLRLSMGSNAGQPWPGMAVHRLANQVGVARARHLVLFGTEVTADRALELGLIDEVTDDPDGRAAAVSALAADLAGPELAIRRRLLLDATATNFEESLGAHLAACDRMLRRATSTVAADREELAQ